MAEKVFYGIVTQFDCDPQVAEIYERRYGGVSGPILYECTLTDDFSADESKVREHAKKFSNRGWVRIAKVIVDMPEGDSSPPEPPSAA